MLPRRPALCCCLAWIALAGLASPGRAADPDLIWVEGEKPAKADVRRHPWWYDMVKRDQFSGGDFLSNFDPNHVGLMSYQVVAPRAGSYELWVRANPTQSKLSCRINDSAWGPIPLETGTVGSVNVAIDDKPDLRFLAWAKAGSVTLRKGTNLVAFRMDSANHNHGFLDCFVLSAVPFRPNGKLRPGQGPPVEAGWFAFDPPADRHAATAGFDLRSLNEPKAGDNGRIAAKDGQFVHSKTGAPVRFWAVNGPSIESGRFPEQARTLAKHGVNLVRLHKGYTDPDGKLDPKQAAIARDVVAAMKGEGIYTHLSIYFPLNLKPTAAHPSLKGYDGTKHPFAALYFDPGFREQYRGWWRAILTTPDPKTGVKLVDDPAVMGVELVNEDSYFFWTFNEQNIPDPELRILEGQFAEWLAGKYGSLDAAGKAWGGMTLSRDRPAEKRVAFRPLYNMANDRTPRDKDTVRFLAESQRRFYRETSEFLRSLGYQGLITASNWITADQRVLGPIEKWTYLPGDFIDRHGYFAGRHKGDNASWSIQDGHTFADRSALRFDPDEPGKPRDYNHPAMDVHYGEKPSMISETTWNRPNRYRTEAPLYLAAYGALQASDAIVHFALDGADWSPKPNFFMQPWTLMSPTQMGQFPAAALIYRKGLIDAGDLMVDLPLREADVFDLKGTPMPQDAAFDELRLKDVPKGTTLAPSNVIDPLVHLVGRTAVRFVEQAESPRIKDLAPFIDHAKQTVRSSNGQVKLDYGKGVLVLDSPRAQGVVGNLAAGAVKTADLDVASPLDLLAVVAVPLDDQPLAKSKRILVQVMSEEKATGFQTRGAANGEKTIVSIGHEPWLAKKIQGTVKLRRPDAASLKVQRLDPNGDPVGPATRGGEVTLDPTTVYYLLTP